MNRLSIYSPRLATCVLLLLAFFASAQAQGDKPSVLHFRIDRSTIDSTYLDNAIVLQQLHGLLSSPALTAHIDTLYILSFSSPDGRRIPNERLALGRSLAVRNHLLERYPYLDATRILPLPQGENWKQLRVLVEADPNIPCREEVLQIIDRVHDAGRCKHLLKILDGGRPYDYLRTHILHRLRNASVCIVQMKQTAITNDPNTPIARLRAIGEVQDTASSSDETGSHTEDSHKEGFGKTDSHKKGFREDGSHYTRPYSAPRFSTAPVLLQQDHSVRITRPLLALKTNLLFDAAMMPNIEVEVPIGKHNRYSINGELMFPWWLFEGDKYCLQILMGGIEGRYWLGNRQKRHVLTGHFLGLYAGGGKYDLQRDRNGYQGEFFIAAGISYGYAHKISRNLRLEYNIGIGLLRTDYEHYHTLDNYQTLLWQDTGRYTWLGPTKLKVSLVWLLNRKVKFMQKGGAR